jgi:UDP-N-acetylglucosamine 2-epimerase (non-hydrolysing)
MNKIAIVVGTRPNFIKVTQFKKVTSELFSGDSEIQIIHTGQHYDHKMADVFFEQFDLKPDIFLEIPPSTPNTQMAEVMLRLEKVMDDLSPDLLMVVGDVNSTFAAALTANKMGIKLAHLESGLRSDDRGMPEEINRILTDEITDYFFVTEESGKKNLLEEGKKEQQIYFVGNTMIDTMVAFDEQIEKSDILHKLRIEDEFALMTIHRPATVDNKKGLQKMISLINAVTKKYRVVFPIHPRTVSRLEKFKLSAEIKSNSRLTLTEPMDYFSFQKLIRECSVVLTDSGGIQEETTFRQVPCLTLRPNTERPSTVKVGSNTLMPFDVNRINEKINKIESGRYKKGKVPPLWDGKSTERILKIVKNL